MSGLLLLVPLNLCLPVIKPTHYYSSFSFNPKGVPPSLVWWFHRDSNPNVFSSVAKCFIQLNYKTNCCPWRTRTSTISVKGKCPAIRRKDNLVGAIGLEPMNSKEGGFTVRSNCRYATLPFCTPGRIRTPVKLTYSFGDCCLSRSATDVYFFFEFRVGFEPTRTKSLVLQTNPINHSGI